jgi:hypothetical protein
MTTNYNVDKFVQGVNGFGSPFCTQIFTATLAANTDTAIAVPLTAAVGMPAATRNNKFLAVFSYAKAVDFWVANNAAAAAPAGAAFAASPSELNPPAKYCKAGDTIHCLSVAGGSMSVAFYAILD